jgi:hypothetical protein
MKRTIIVCCMMLVPLVNGACDRDDGQTAGEAVESAARQTGDALDTAAEKTGQVLGEATDDAVALAKDASQDVKRATTQVIPGDAEAIYDVLEDATEAALQPGGFDDFVQRLAAADRDRIGEDYAEKSWPDLDDMAAKVQAKWEAAQGGSLDIDEKAAFANVPVTLEPGGTAANVTLPSAGAGSAVRINLRKEADGWRIDAPDSLTGENLKNALISRYGEVLQDNPALTGPPAAAQRTMVTVVVGAVGA